MFATRRSSDPAGPGASPAGRGSARRRPAFSLAEVLVVLVVMGILIAMAIPSFQRGIEHARADVAAANLRAIWTAQRLYWLEHRTYATTFDALVNEGLLDAMMVGGNGHFDYSLAAGASASFATSFQATAARRTEGDWSGAFVIDQTGAITGTIASSSDQTSPGNAYSIEPSFQ